MRFKTIHTLLIGLLLLFSLNVQAQFVQYQERYEGYLPLENSWDGVYFIGEASFHSQTGSVLNVYYEALSAIQDQLFGVFGHYSRSQDPFAPLGQFDFWLSQSDPNMPFDPSLGPVPLEGSFSFEESLMLPDGNIEVFYQEFGLFKGYLSPQNDLTFTIDWSVYARDRATVVPEPAFAWLWLIGLFTLAASSRLRRHY